MQHTKVEPKESYCLRELYPHGVKGSIWSKASEVDKNSSQRIYPDPMRYMYACPCVNSQKMHSFQKQVKWMKFGAKDLFTTNEACIHAYKLSQRIHSIQYLVKRIKVELIWIANMVILVIQRHPRDRMPKEPTLNCYPWVNSWFGVNVKQVHMNFWEHKLLYVFQSIAVN